MNESFYRQRIWRCFMVFLAIGQPLHSFAQERIISGTVTDENNAPLPGVNVLQKETTNGTSTNADGKYSLSLSQENVVLVFSFIGYLSQEVPVGAQTAISVVMQPDLQTLNEVVVVGYGTQKKINLTGSLASVDGDILLEAPLTNLSNGLVGRLPGLIAVQGNGKPGSGSSISIRGASTLGNNNALTVVDGIVRDFQNIDPNEIESISILKDASATAVYGSRAANGVILVTTKRGANGKPKFNYTTFVGIQQPTTYPRVMDGYEYAVTKNAARENMGLSAQYTQQEIDDIQSGVTPQTNWYDLTLKEESLQTQHNINVTGGTDAISYFMSLGYLNQQGLFDKLNFKRYSLRSNVDARVNQNLTISTSFDIRTQENNGSAYSPEKIFRDIILAYPLDVPYNPDGTIAYQREPHPLAEISTGYDEETTDVSQVNLQFEQKIPFIKGLNAIGKIGLGSEKVRDKNYLVPIYMYRQDDDGNLIEIYNAEGYNGKIALTESTNEYKTTTINASLNYNRTLVNHSVSGLFLYEQFAANGNNFSAFRTNFPVNGLDELLFGGDDGEQDANGSSFDDARRSYVFRGNYSFRSRYLLEASLRIDGSAAFPASKKYGYFPAFSAGWLLSEESFLTNSNTLSFISYLKLRASYGVVGSDRNVYDDTGRIPSFQYQQAYQVGATLISGNEPQSTITPGNLANPDITWERAAITNLGLDGSLWNGKLQFETDLFYKRTSDILEQRIRSVPGTLGASLPAENYAEVDNRGFEVALSHNNSISGFNYFVKVNGSYAKSKVVTLDEAANLPDYLRQTGRPLDFIVGYKSLGYFSTDSEVGEYLPQFNGGQQAGDVKYADVNNDGSVNSNDQTVISTDNSTPKIIGGLSFGGSYKNFDVSILFQGAAKVQKLLSDNAAIFFANGSENTFAELLDYWTPQNTDAKYPRPWEGSNPNNNLTSNLYLRDASFVRLKSVDVGYTFPTRITDKGRIDKLRVYFSGSNLFVWSKLKMFDPEFESSSGRYYPQQRTLNIGANLTF